MNTIQWIQSIVVLFLVAFSGFFSASETALTSMNLIKARQLEKEDRKNVKSLIYLLQHPSEFMSAILIGNNLVNILATSIATVLFTQLFGTKGPVLSTISMTLLVLIFGEITPKTIANQNSEDFSLMVSKPIEIIAYVLKPFIFVLDKFVRVLINLFFPQTQQEPLITEEEFINIVNVSDEEGVLEEEQAEFINNVITFQETLAFEVMIPRTDFMAYNIEDGIDGLKEALKNSSVFSRIPVYEETIDNIIGILHIKDLVFHEKEDINIKDFLKKPFFAYENFPIVELFQQMRTQNITMSIIIDEYGGTAGLITMEDIVEELVGDIDDEFDGDEKLYRKIRPMEYIVDPTMRIEEFNLKFDTYFLDDQFETVGGLVMGILDRIPMEGDSVTKDRIEFKVLEMDHMRIHKLLIKDNRTFYTNN